MNKIYDLEGKNKAVVLFKFFAALLITWSHLGALFPRYGALVTGGAIGDGLFFFCSGFTLFLGRDGGFINWYRRRVSRIYPSIIMWALFSAVAFGWMWNVTDVVTTPKYWFIPCIMVYYAIFYVIRRFLMNHMKAVFCGAFLLIAVLSLFVLDMHHSVMYAQVSFMRIYYFMFMLLGAMVALDLRRGDNEMVFGRLYALSVRGGKISALRAFVLFFGSVALYYVCMGVYKIDAFFCNFQMVSLVPLLLAIYWFFMLCSSDKMLRCFDNVLSGNVVYAISALTLEIYLVQYALFTDKMNGIFPLNIPLTYLAIFAVAYVLKCLSQVFAWVFGGGEFDAGKIFRI